jgi:hypothetical protein
MKWTIIILAVNLSGCAAVYTGASTASLLATGKSIPDHAATQVSGADCSALRVVTGEKDFYCEERDPSKTYNRNRF